MLSARCDRCHQSVAGGQTVCPHCGGAVSEESGDLRPLLPEAEPPLPAAHEALRTRTPPQGAMRKDPTPLPRRRDPTPARKDPTPVPTREELGDTPLPQRESRQVVAAIAEPPPSVPGPMEIPRRGSRRASSARPPRPRSTSSSQRPSRRRAPPSQSRCTRFPACRCRPRRCRRSPSGAALTARSSPSRSACSSAWWWAGCCRTPRPRPRSARTHVALRPPRPSSGLLLPARA